MREEVGCCGVHLRAATRSRANSFLSLNLSPSLSPTFGEEHVSLNSWSFVFDQLLLNIQGCNVYVKYLFNFFPYVFLIILYFVRVNYVLKPLYQASKRISVSERRHDKRLIIWYQSTAIAVFVTEKYWILTEICNEMVEKWFWLANTGVLLYLNAGQAEKR